MDKNFFIALGVSLLFYAGYTLIFPQQHITAPIKPAVQATASDKQTAIQAAVPQTETVKTVPAVEAKQESLFTVQTKEADVVFTNKGAAIKDFVFKDVIAPINLTPYKGPGFFATLDNVYFERVDSAEADMAFRAELIPGVEAVKQYTFSKDGGINAVTLKIVNKTAQDLDVSGLKYNFGPGLATVKSEESDNPANWNAVCMIQEEGKKKPTVNNVTEKEMKNPAKLQEACKDWQWAGISNRYFLVALVPQNWTTKAEQLSVTKQFVYNKDSFFGLFGQKPVSGPQLEVALPSVVPAGGEVTYSADFYFGPKDYEKLVTMPYNFERSIQFGFFGQFGKMAHSLLEWLYGVTKNYGAAIIIMTILIQLIMFPLTYKQLKSSAVMQKIQPEMKRIQEKYKEDPAMQQREMMALYKKYGANPLSGCLPLFIQLPIFLALFNALRTSWALHGAPFALWIQDLSAKDPYYVLPIAMGAVMFVQQKLTMPDFGKDNPSMAMMKWMPVFMTVIFLNFPAGLTLYWFISNCISFAINLVLKKKLAKAF